MHQLNFYQIHEELSMLKKFVFNEIISFFLVDFDLPIEAASENPHVFITNGTEAKLLVKQKARNIKSVGFENML